MQRKLIILAAISIAAIAAFSAGCSNAPSAQEILLRAATATQGVTSVTTAAGLVAATDTKGGAHPGTADIVMSGSGIIDISRRSSSLSLEMTFNPPGEATQKVGTEIFVIGDWEYVNYVQNPGWTKFSLPAGAKRPDSQLQQQALLLRTALTASVTGQEEIDGVQCYVLKVTPDLKSLWQWFLYQGEAAGLQQPGPASLDLATATREAQLKVWIDRDRFFVRKVQGSMTVEFNAADVGASPTDFSSISVVLSSDLSLTGYNAPVDVRLPPDALNATDITGQKTGK